MSRPQAVCIFDNKLYLKNGFSFPGMNGQARNPDAGTSLLALPLFHDVSREGMALHDIKSPKRSFHKM